MSTTVDSTRYTGKFDYWVATTHYADDRGRIFRSERDAEAFIAENGAKNWAKRRKGTQIHAPGAFGGIRTAHHWMDWDRGSVTRTGRQRRAALVTLLARMYRGETP